MENILDDRSAGVVSSGASEAAKRINLAPYTWALHFGRFYWGKTILGLNKTVREIKSDLLALQPDVGAKWVFERWTPAAPIAGTLYIILGGLLLAAAAVCIAAGVINLFGFLIGFGILLPPGLAIFKRGVACLREGGADLLKRDQRPPIVLLRSFADDDARFYSKDRWWHWLSLDPTGCSYIWPGKTRAELAMDKRFSKCGPFVAVGKPGEFGPRVGARRAYFPNEVWQTEVSKLIERARFIVVVPGLTEGVGWEIDRIIAGKYLEKTIVLFPLDGRRKRQRRLDMFSKEFMGDRGVALPLAEDLKYARALVFDEFERPIIIETKYFGARVADFVLQTCVYLLLLRANGRSAPSNETAALSGATALAT